MKTFVIKNQKLIRVLIILGVGIASQARGNQIAVKPAVELEPTKSDIMLSDVISANGLSRTAIEKFKQIKISDAPKAGESRVFTDSTIADSVKDDIEAVEAATGEHFELKIPSRVTVVKKKSALRAAVLKEMLVAQFKSLCKDCDFDISNLNAPFSANLAADAQWNLRQPKELPKGSFSYPIEVTVNDVPVQTYWVTGQLTVRRNVPVAAREIAPGERIQPDDVVNQMKDVTFASDAPITTGELSAGVAARGLSVGQIVFRSAIRKELAIRMGDVVKVTTGNDEWQISLDGVSQTSGYVGDKVNVKIPKTQKLVSGILREKGVVEVQ